MGRFSNFLSAVFSKDLAIDLGTQNTRLSIKGYSGTESELSVVAAKWDNQGKWKVLGAGFFALRELRSPPDAVEPIRSLNGKVFASTEIVEAMLRHCISRANSSWKPRIVFCVPAGLVAEEKDRVMKAAQRAGAREIYLLEGILAAAIGADVPVWDSTPNMVVDIGAGSTDIGKH